MLALPRRTYSLREKERISVFLSLLDLLYGQCYDGRIREGDEDFGCETGWCAAKLSATLSACTKHKSIKDAVRTCIRRLELVFLYIFPFGDFSHLDHNQCFKKRIFDVVSKLD